MHPIIDYFMSPLPENDFTLILPVSSIIHLPLPSTLYNTAITILLKRLFKKKKKTFIYVQNSLIVSHPAQGKSSSVNMALRTSVLFPSNLPTI